MEYSIHKRRKLRPPKRQKAILPAPIIERSSIGVRHQRQDHAPAVTVRPDPDHVVAPQPVHAPDSAAPNEPAYVTDRRELVRLIHETAGFPVGLQRGEAITPPETIASGSVVQRRPTSPAGDAEPPPSGLLVQRRT